MTDTSSIVYLSDVTATPVGVPVPAAGAQTVFGQGAPAAGIGADGFYYVDLLTLAIYGPRVAGLWPPPWQSPKAQARGLPLTAGAAIAKHASLMFAPDGTAVVGDPSSATYLWAGIAADDAAAAAPVLAVREGIVTDATWSWEPFVPLFAAGSGALTQSAPPNGLYHRIGTALSATKALIAPEPLIMRA